MSIIKLWLKQTLEICKVKLTKYYKDIIYILCLLIMFSCLLFSVNRCTYYKSVNNNNIEAFTDSIHYYKDKNGELVASKLLVEGEFNDLKRINSELYDKIKAMSIGGKPDQVISVENTIVNEIHDTTIVVRDSVAKFEFINKYRALSGNIHTSADSLNLKIDKDEVYFNYTLALKGNKVWISSDNPYVKFNEITGLTLPKVKQKKFGIGPSISAGINPITKKLDYMIGMSASYHILEW